MIARQDFDQGIDLLAANFGRRISDATREVWYRMLAPDFNTATWTAACASVIRDEDSWPGNFVRAMRSLVPKKAWEYDPTNPETGRPYTKLEAAKWDRRLQALQATINSFNTHGPSSPYADTARAILSAADACGLEGDSKTALSRYGADIVHILDEALHKFDTESEGEEAPF